MQISLFTSLPFFLHHQLIFFSVPIEPFLSSTVLHMRSHTHVSKRLTKTQNPRNLKAKRTKTRRSRVILSSCSQLLEASATDWISIPPISTLKQRIFSLMLGTSHWTSQTRNSRRMSYCASMPGTSITTTTRSQPSEGLKSSSSCATAFSTSLRTKCQLGVAIVAGRDHRWQSGIPGPHAKRSKRIMEG